ncbi:MAG: HAD hydrolase-like protein [Methanomassiliicoccales archaeon]
MKYKAAVMGAETIFYTPSIFPLHLLPRIEEMFAFEGYEITPSRLNALISTKLNEREKHLSSSFNELKLTLIVGNVLEDLEIEDIELQMKVVDLVASELKAQIQPLQGAQEFLSSLKDAGLKMAVLWNSPFGMPHYYISERLEALSLRQMFDDMQFSTENGIVRPHARPARFALSNIDVSPCDAIALTGLQADLQVFQKIRIGHVFLCDERGTGKYEAIYEEVLKSL